MYIFIVDFLLSLHVLHFSQGKPRAHYTKLTEEMQRLPAKLSNASEGLQGPQVRHTPDGLSGVSHCKKEDHSTSTYLNSSGYMNLLKYQPFLRERVQTRSEQIVKEEAVG